MDRLIVNRIEQEDCTLGVVNYKKFRCYSLELPNKDNKVNVSCIAYGLYDCEKYYSEKYGTTCFRVLNVVGRTAISGHYGNWLRDILGCLIFGDSISPTSECPSGVMVTNSKVTLSKLIDKLPDRFQMIIK